MTSSAESCSCWYSELGATELTLVSVSDLKVLNLSPCFHSYVAIVAEFSLSTCFLARLSSVTSTVYRS